MAMKIARAALGLLMVAVSAMPALAQVDPGPQSLGMPVHIERDSMRDKVASFEYQGGTAYVRIEAREPGSGPNEHPVVAVQSAMVRNLLLAITLPGDNHARVFNDAEIDEIAGPLAKALGHANADQDICFAVSGRHGNFGPFSPREVTTARVFRAGGKINLVFGLVHHDFDTKFKATGVLIAFEPGRRAAPIAGEPQVAIDDSVGNLQQANWLAVSNVAGLTASAVAAPSGAAPAPGSAAVLPPAPIANPVAPTPAPAARSLYDATAERLKALTRLRDDGLITQEEFDRKRRDIINNL